MEHSWSMPSFLRLHRDEYAGPSSQYLLQKCAASSIIGGGLNGLVTAYYLQQSQPLNKANIFILEATQEVGGGSISTSRADIGKIYRLLHSPNQIARHRIQVKQHPRADVEIQKNDCADVVATLGEELLLGFHSVNPEGLRVDGICNGTDLSKTSEGGCHGKQTIELDFGVGLPHLSAPGGGHVLQLVKKLILPSDIFVSRRESASLFALPRGHTNSAATWWPFSTRFSRAEKTSFADPGYLPPCKAGLSRMQLVLTVGAVARQISKLLVSCLTASLRTQTSEGGHLWPFSWGRSTCQTSTQPLRGEQAFLGIVEDTSVWDFACWNATKTLARDVLLPGFSACTYAGIPSALSASAYFPRAFLLQKMYGSFLYGALAERWWGSSHQDAKCNASGETLTTKKAVRNKEKSLKLTLVEGSIGMTTEDPTYQMVASEGRGIFCFRGGMRKLVKELEKYITKPPAEFKPVNIYFNSKVVYIAPHNESNQDGEHPSTLTEVVCSNGSKFHADIVISALHPYELASILTSRPSGKRSHNAVRGGGDTSVEANICEDDNRESYNMCDSLASYLFALPSVSWVSIHAFAANNGPHARHLGMGCFYPTKSHNVGSVTTKQNTVGNPHKTAADPLRPCMDSPILGLVEAIRRAKESVEVAHLRLPGNLFPHAQATALAAAGLGDPTAATWATSAQLLHAHAEVRVHGIESLVEELEGLLLPLKEATAKRASVKDASSREMTQDAGIHALSLIILSAEDAVVRSLLREGLVSRPEDLLLTSRLVTQGALEWPLGLELVDSATGNYLVAMRRRLRKLSQQLEYLGKRPSNDALFLRSQTLPSQVEPFTRCPPTAYERERVPLSAARRRMHELRLENYPGLQIVGAPGCLSEWGLGAAVKDAAIVARQIWSRLLRDFCAGRFDSFPVVKEEQREDFEARLNGGWCPVS